MNKKMTVKPVNDIKYFYKVLLSLGLSQNGLARLMNCSNAVNYWALGYRVVPRSFKRFILVLQFVNKKGLMPELLEFIKTEERKNVN